MKTIHLLTALALLSWSCVIRNTVEGNGETKKIFYQNIESCNKIKVAGGFDVILVDNNTDSIFFEIENNLEPYINIIERNNQIVIQEKKHYKIKETFPIKIYLDIDKLEEIKTSGSGNIETDYIENKKCTFAVSGSGNINTSILRTERFVAKIEGSGSISATVEAGIFNGDISGSGNINISGKAPTAQINIDGSGNLNCSKLETKITTIEVNGSGNVHVSCDIELHVTIEGSGNVYCAGNPKISSTIKGSGEIRHK